MHSPIKARGRRRGSRAIAQDAGRNQLVFNDVLAALEHGRCLILLTERRDHLDLLEETFSRCVRNLVVLRGGMTQKAREEAQAMRNALPTGERLVLSTGRRQARYRGKTRKPP